MAQAAYGNPMIMKQALAKHHRYSLKSGSSPRTEYALRHTVTVFAGDARDDDAQSPRPRTHWTFESRL